MNRSLLATSLLGASILGVGCGEPLHLGYDHGRAYTEAFMAQADLTRPSVANEQYVLYGIEGVQIRLNVQEVSTEQESGAVTAGD